MTRSDIRSSIHWVEQAWYRLLLRILAEAGFPFICSSRIICALDKTPHCATTIGSNTVCEYVRYNDLYRCRLTAEYLSSSGLLSRSIVHSFVGSAASIAAGARSPAVIDIVVDRACGVPRTHNTFGDKSSNSLLPVRMCGTIYRVTCVRLSAMHSNWKHFCLGGNWQRRIVVLAHLRPRNTLTCVFPSGAFDYLSVQIF